MREKKNQATLNLERYLRGKPEALRRVQAGHRYDADFVKQKPKPVPKPAYSRDAIIGKVVESMQNNQRATADLLTVLAATPPEPPPQPPQQNINVPLSLNIQLDATLLSPNEIHESETFIEREPAGFIKRTLRKTFSKRK